MCCVSGCLFLWVKVERLCTMILCACFVGVVSDLLSGVLLLYVVYNRDSYYSFVGHGRGPRAVHVVCCSMAGTCSRPKLGLLLPRLSLLC